MPNVGSITAILQQSFKTDNLDLFQGMLRSAVACGLTFEAYDDGKGHYIIEYTGGF